MVSYVNRLSELNFGKLMEVYEEGNRENGAELYPEEGPEQQLLFAEQNFYQFLQETFFKTPGAVYALWVENGRYISTLRLEPYRDGLLLEALETRPDRRRRGYATRLMAKVLADKGGQRIYSHILKGNIASVKTHERAGFRKILDYSVYVDGSVNRACDTYCFEGESQNAL